MDTLFCLTQKARQFFQNLFHAIQFQVFFILALFNDWQAE
ncbi:hypothetical protein HSIEG1_1494 [Enterococcus sp. HSIEG1]|nr:hypothetical protein HSIEG1_1494 [Enterococcus sp. HSIEG1]